MSSLTRIAPFLLACTIGLVACGGEDDASTSTAPPASESEAVAQTSPSTPIGQDPTSEEMERQRFSDAWRALDSIKRAMGRSSEAKDEPAQAESQSTFAFRGNRKESFENATIESVQKAPVLVPIEGDVAGPSVLKAQVYLDHANYSPGVIDGRWGKNTAIAVYWFQHSNGIEPTGSIDERTFRRLESKASVGTALTRYSISKSDLEGPFVSLPEDPYEKAELDCLCYESISEKLAEDFHTTPEFLALLNPGVDFATLTEGTQIVVPNVPKHHSKGDVSEVIVSIAGNYLQGLDGQGNIVFHYPTTVGSEYDPSPSEELKITAFAWDPTFHYQPKLYHEVPDDEPDVVMQPGPNSPVGIVWMQLSKDNYGIHGTAAPSTIGYASSHGCIRLTNWDARELGNAAEKGTRVVFADPRSAAPEGSIGG